MSATGMHDVLLVHPAPLRLIPARARVERTVYERVRTPARIREADPSEMRRIGTLTTLFNGRRVELHDHEGATWIPFMGPGGGRPVLAENLLAFLAGEPVAIGSHGMPSPLVWTPLHAWEPVTRRDPSRGTEPAAAIGGRIVEDGRDRARSEASAWVGRELRICDGRGWIRLRGPMAHPYAGGEGRIEDAYQVAIDPMAYASTAEPMDSIVRADGIDGHAAFRAEREGGLPLREVGTQRLLGLDVPLSELPGADGDDLAMACNHGLVHVVRRAGLAVDAAGLAGDDRAAVDAAFARLAGHAMRARVSGVRPDEFAEVLRGMDDLLRTAIARLPPEARWVDRLERQRAWLAHALLPRVAAADMEADEGALMELGR